MHHKGIEPLLLKFAFVSATWALLFPICNGFVWLGLGGVLKKKNKKKLIMGKLMQRGFKEPI